ncbi:RICIN domain-containing protein [Solwaraspora sp. WMMD406]|uniref:RICIN domain-containing protein n=1 Tax=Solwaraspora sp. WMMD406 TaxID=3016095 RepID=UPI003242BC4D
MPATAARLVTSSTGVPRTLSSPRNRMSVPPSTRTTASMSCRSIRKRYASRSGCTPSGQTLRVLGKCLDIPSNATNGSRVVVWDCHGNANQRWSRV